jgi:cellulase/cellobiase CelA1
MGYSIVYYSLYIIFIFVLLTRTKEYSSSIYLYDIHEYTLTSLFDLPIFINLYYNIVYKIFNNNYSNIISNSNSSSSGSSSNNNLLLLLLLFILKYDQFIDISYNIRH